MSLPHTDQAPAFRITRLSHAVIDVTDIPASRSFYEELVGLVVTEAEDDVVYLRGVEETAHHSLVLRRGPTSRARRLGFRVATEDDLDAAKQHLEAVGMMPEWIEVPHQGRTLHFVDAGGVPLELCVTMPPQRRHVLEFAAFRGGAATRIDHAQVHVTDPSTYARFYTQLGFRISEYATESGTPETPLLGVFLSKKGDLLDLVALRNRGPRLHHVAFTVHDASFTLPKVCDLAASLGIRDSIEYGPGRHGLAPQQFLYLRDPDGHRVELVSHAYQLLDPEVEPVGWSIGDPGSVTQWGPLPHEAWWQEASPFSGSDVAEPIGDVAPATSAETTAGPA